MKQDKFLICGATGFIGSHVLQRLLASGHNVRATWHKAWPLPLLQPEPAWVKADLCSRSDCARVTRGIDTVFMCAASTKGAAVIVGNPLELVTSNIIMIAYMLEAAYAAHVKQFVYISSSVVYPETGELPAMEPMAFYAEPYWKYWWVGHMKRYAERLCLGYATRVANPMEMIVIRPSNCFGPRDKFDPSIAHAVPALVYKIVACQDPLEVWGTGEDIRDLIYVEDLVDGIMLALDKADGFLAVNIATGRSYSVNDVLRLLLEICDYQYANIVYLKDKPTTIPIRLLDTTRARELLGFEPKTSLEEGLRKTVEWYKKTKRMN